MSNYHEPEPKYNSILIGTPTFPLRLLVSCIYLSYLLCLPVWVWGYCAVWRGMLCATCLGIVVGGTQYLTQGNYDYYHYMQDKFDDNVFGCPRLLSSCRLCSVEHMALVRHAPICRGARVNVALVTSTCAAVLRPRNSIIGLFGRANSFLARAMCTRFAS